MPQLLTLNDVAKIPNTSRAWVRDHATRRNPRIPVVRLGGKRAILRFRPEDIESFIKAHLSVQGEGALRVLTMDEKWELPEGIAGSTLGLTLNSRRQNGRPFP